VTFLLHPRLTVLRAVDRLKCDGTRAETRFRLSAKRTSPFKSAGDQFSRLLAAEVCASTVVMLDTSSEVVRRVLVTQSIRQFPLHYPSRASPCAITFQLDCTFTCPFVCRTWHGSSYGTLTVVLDFNLEKVAVTLQEQDG